MNKHFWQNNKRPSNTFTVHWHSWIIINYLFSFFLMLFRDCKFIITIKMNIIKLWGHTWENKLSNMIGHLDISCGWVSTQSHSIYNMQIFWRHTGVLYVTYCFCGQTEFHHSMEEAKGKTVFSTWVRKLGLEWLQGLLLNCLPSIPWTHTVQGDDEKSLGEAHWYCFDFLLHSPAGLES